MKFKFKILENEPGVVDRDSGEWDEIYCAVINGMLAGGGLPDLRDSDDSARMEKLRKFATATATLADLCYLESVREEVEE